MITTKPIAALDSSRFEIPASRVQLIVVETLFREMWTRWALLLLHLLVPRVVQGDLFQPSAHLCTLPTLHVSAIRQANVPTSLPRRPLQRECVITPYESDGDGLIDRRLRAVVADFGRKNLAIVVFFVSK